MTILVTGFEPFGSENVNASWEVASRISSEINGVRVVVRQLPVIYYKSVKAVMKILEADPSISDVILLGQAGGRSRVSVEMIGVNRDDCAAADNSGAIRQGEPVDPEGPAAYFSTLPVKPLIERLIVQSQVPVYRSWTAGQFVCNHTLYGVLHAVKEKNINVRAGFVHLPYSSAQGAMAGFTGLPVTEMVRIIELMIQHLIVYTEGEKAAKPHTNTAHIDENSHE